MTHRRNAKRCAAILLGFYWALGYSAALQDAAHSAAAPETMMVTLRAKRGSEAALERVIAQHWTTARRLNLVRETPHVTLRAAEAGNQVYFVDIFTWRDSGIPDAAPSEIRKIWDEMNRLVEARGGHPGLEFAEVSVVAPARAEPLTRKL